MGVQARRNAAVVLRVLVCVAPLLRACRSEIFDLDADVPWLRSRGNEVRFDAGWDAFLVVDSSCVRVTARGVQAKPSHWAPRTLGGGWSSRACMPGAGGGLCDVASGGVAFPARAIGRPPLYNGSAGWGGLGCSRGSDGRVMDPDYAYDLSACDVLDGGGDVVVCGRTISFARTALPDWVYWAMCLIAVFVVRSLSYLVVQRVTPPQCGGEAARPARSVWGDALTVLACVAVLPLALVPDGDAWFVTQEEALFFGVVCAYVGVYAALFVVYALNGGGEDPPIYNLIAATLQVIASRLYLGAETPYNPVIIWAVATRALIKMRGKCRRSVVVGLSTLLDSLVLSLMCVLGFEYNPLYLVAIFALSLAVSDTLM